MLVVEGLTCRFGTKAAVDNASFSIQPGSFVGVIGRSGAGKSTLLRMINRLAEPSEGRILFEGIDVTALRGKELRQWRARSAMIFQQFNLVGRLDVLTNVLMGRLATVPAWRSLAQLWPEEDKAIAMSALEQFDMASIAAQRAWARTIRSSCAALFSGPRSAASPPTCSAAAAAASAAPNSWWMDSSTSTRVTAVQSWPALKNAPSAISLAARSMSVSAKTIAGALPPSSRWTSLRVFDAADITCAPARVEPVMDTISGIS